MPVFVFGSDIPVIPDQMFQSYTESSRKTSRNKTFIQCRYNPYPAKVIYLNFHPLEVVSRYRDPQLQVGENCAYLFILRSNIWES